MQSLEIIVFQLILEANQPHNFLPPPKKNNLGGEVLGFQETTLSRPSNYKFNYLFKEN